MRKQLPFLHGGTTIWLLATTPSVSFASGNTLMATLLLKEEKDNAQEFFLGKIE